MLQIAIRRRRVKVSHLELVNLFQLLDFNDSLVADSVLDLFIFGIDPQKIKNKKYGNCFCYFKDLNNTL